MTDAVPVGVASGTGVLGSLSVTIIFIVGAGVVVGFGVEVVFCVVVASAVVGMSVPVGTGGVATITGIVVGAWVGNHDVRICVGRMAAAEVIVGEGAVIKVSVAISVVVVADICLNVSAGV